ncbi:MAG: InlB B-repeat-containing protein [Oscillospiraceae bacterium]|nr:InlB B-repeat-containing protein [Oscillospiraceae bacterium]
MKNQFRKLLAFVLFVCMLFGLLPSTTIFAADENTSASLSSSNPILVVNSNSANTFGAYMGEILKEEGFNEFETEDINNLSEDYLNQFDVVILTETSVTSEQSAMLEQYVNDGGNLIGIQPDAQLYNLFGISGTSGAVSEGYIKIDTSTEIGRGLISETMKFHGDADKYGLTTGSKIASLYNNSVTDSGSAAVAANEYGGGRTAAFSFDLCKSIVYTRQGNPANAGVDTNNDGYLRAGDLMYQKDGGSYNDNTKVEIPQADEQMRLLSHIIEWMNTSTMPLPRLWYFPDGKKAMTVFTGDSDGAQQNFADEFNTVMSYGGHASIYSWVSDMIDSPAQIKTWTDEGNEFAIHFEHASEPSWASADATIASAESIFDNKYGSVSPSPTSVRNHCVIWCGTDSNGLPEFAAQAMLERKYGIMMDFNYYNVFDFLNLGNPGFENGSGMPMKFSTSKGEVLDIYQNDTQLPDEYFHYTIAANYKTMLDNALNNEDYAWLTANFHPAGWLNGDGSGYKSEAVQVLAYSKSNGIPICSGRDMYNFTNMRDSASFKNIAWDNNTSVLTFNVSSPAQGQGYGNLTAMIPAFYDGHILESINGVPASGYDVETVKGNGYAFVTAHDGDLFTAEYSNDAIPAVTIQSNVDGNSITVTEKDQIGFTLSADNGGNEVLVPITFSADKLPDSATLNAQTGEFKWTPSVGQYGVYNITFTASDKLSLDSVTITITVKSFYNLPDNSESIWGTSVKGITAGYGGAYELGTVFSPIVDGEITHVKIFGFSGVYGDANISGQETGTHNVSIWESDAAFVPGTQIYSGTATYTGDNEWVYIELPEPVQVQAGHYYTVSVSTQLSDPYLYASINNSPATAGNNGKNLIYPAYAGVYGDLGTQPMDNQYHNNYLRDVVFVPNDGAVKAPTFSDLTDQTVKEGESLSFTVLATSENGQVTYSADVLPDGATLNAQTGEFKWTPSVGQSGVYNVKFTADDGVMVSNKTITITVTATVVPQGGEETIWGNIDETADIGAFQGDGVSYNLGTVFYSSEPGNITSVRVYGIPGETGEHTITIWNNDGDLVFGPEVFDYTGANKWEYYNLDSPLHIDADVYYTVSVSTGTDDATAYPAIQHASVSGNNGGCLYYPDNFGVANTDLTFTARPTDTYGCNYLRDVVFIPDGVEPPMVTLDKLAVTTPPKTIEYTVGDVLDLTGMVVTATYSSEDSKAVSGYKTNPAEGSKLDTEGTQTVTVSYTENGVTKTTSFDVTVNAAEVDNTPIFDAIADKTVAEGNSLSFTVHAVSDRDLTYSAANLPGGASFDSDTQKFGWTPDVGQHGIYSVTFTATDGTNEASYTVRITVKASGDFVLPDNAETIWGDLSTDDGIILCTNSGTCELGTIFTPSVDGTITYIRVFAYAEETGDHHVAIYNNSTGEAIYEDTVSFDGNDGWVYLPITSTPVKADVSYTVSVSTDAAGNYAAISNNPESAGDNGSNLSYPKQTGVYSAYGTYPAVSLGHNYLRDVVFIPDGTTPTVTHKVTFFDSDGTTTLADSQTVADGGKAKQPADPSKDGYTFDGWSYGGATLFDFGVAITSDVTLIAQWTAVPVTTYYTVIFQDWNGDKIGEQQSVAEGGNAKAPSDPTRTGYTFTGWDNSFEDIKGDLTIIAQYKIDSYEVTFVDWDGTTLKSEMVDYNTSATPPVTNPTRTGYTFTGWDPEDFSQIIEPTTVTAQYNINVTFVDSDGTTVLGTDSVPYGETATPPTNLTKAGYTFIGWVGDYSNITEPTTVTAQWEEVPAIIYTVTFDADNGTDPTTVPVTNGDYVDRPMPDPVKDGCNFCYWYSDDEGSAFDFSTPITSDVELTAEWELISTNNPTVTVGTATGKAGDTVKVPVTLTENPGIVTYTVEITFDNTKLEYVGCEQSDVFADSVAAGDGRFMPGFLNEINAAGKFWVTADNGSSVFSGDGTMFTLEFKIKDDAVTYAKVDLSLDSVLLGSDEVPISDITKSDGWIKITVPTFMVTFIGFDGNPIGDTQTVKYGESATAPTAPAVTGYTFTGWDNSFEDIKGDLTVTAQYKINSYEVTFVDWDGTTLKSEMVDYNTSATPPATNPTRTGYTFKGWFTDLNTKVTDFSNIKSDLTVTAQYDKNTYTVIFNDKDGNLIKEQSVKYGEFATAPMAPAVPGYKFTGWFTDSNTKVTDFSDIEGDLTVTAIYEPLGITLKGGSHFNIENGFITGSIAGDGTTVGDLLNELANNHDNIKVYDRKGNEITDPDTLLGTGMVIILENGDNKDTKTVVVKFDLNGDGDLNFKDFMIFSRYYGDKNLDELGAARQLALGVTGDIEDDTLAFREFTTAYSLK